MALKVSRSEGDEPEILARLQHTHIVPIYSVHDDPVSGLRLLCMPYLGGANLAIVQVGIFHQEMTAGRGFLALVAVIFGRWRPFGVLVACLALGAADAMQLNDQSAYDVIAVTGSLPIYDERFQQALRIGGRLFVVVGQAPIMEAWRVVRVGEREWQRQALFETVLEPLVNAPRPSAFVF